MPAKCLDFIYQFFVNLLQGWFGYSDVVTEEVLYVTTILRWFAA